MKRLAAHLAALLVVLGILAPLGAGTLAATGLAEGRTLIVCTGDGLRLMQIGTDGIPVETSDSAGHCALVHAAGTAAAILPAPLPRRLVAADTRPLERLPARVARPVLPSRPRAPPAA